VDKFQIPSVLRIMLTSNDAWMVPATKDERRYAVFNVASTHKDDHAYFKAIADQMAAGGYGAFLHYLQALDLTGFEVRKIPQTELASKRSPA
jgi:hypothetical protein